MARSFTREVAIASLGGSGDGIAETDQGRVYVPYTVPGDRVGIRLGKASESGQRGELIELLSAGPARVEPPCEHFYACGGCALQHVENGFYAAWKREQVVAALARRGLETEVLPLWQSPIKDRRRVDLAARRLGDRTLLGFHEAGSRRIVDIVECFVMQPGLLERVAPLRALLHRLLPPGGALDAKLTAAENGYDLLLEGALALDLPARAAIPEFAAAQRIVRIAHADRGELDILLQAETPIIRMDEVALSPPPGAFLQASPAAERRMQAAAMDLLGAARSIVDLYAGCGTFSLPLGRTARVLAVEAEAGALAALQRAAGASQRAVETERRDLVRRPLDPGELKRFDAALIDPPRIGAREQAVQLAASMLQRLVYVSCAPGSFARDAAILVGGGFRLVSVLPIDQFVWSPHVELVGYFAR